MEKQKPQIWLWKGTSNSFLIDSIGIGALAKKNGLNDLRQFATYDDMRNAYQQAASNTDVRVPYAYWQFLHKIRVGDIVVVFEVTGYDKMYHLLYGWGIIASDVFQDNHEDDYIRRKVNWHLPSLNKPIEDHMMGNNTFFHCPKNDKETENIIQLLNINNNFNNMETKYKKYIDLLESNKNLILTGAPGTGKTYLAKRIAEEMGAKVGFVQFHPSYDYTDFVEGLRPRNDSNGNVVFVRKDGVFKDFCKCSLLSSNTFESKKNVILSDSRNEALLQFKNDIRYKGEIDIQSFRSNTKLKVVLNDKDNIAVVHIQNPWSITDSRMLKYLEKRVCHKNDTYTKTIGDYILEHYYIDEKNRDNQEKKRLKLSHPDIIPSDEIETFRSKVNKENSNIKPYVFIVDEINRGEISKIFGELFFSIDPGYRGEKGKVNTQYQNMIEEGDVFKDGFYVPENVYIIGTMNDIDRSVESMDFAMRRRFAWKEVTAEESMQMLDGIPNEQALKNRMRNLNNAILKIQGLGKAYQIGAAYFKKIENYDCDFEKLWKYHLEGLLAEYLRGNQNADIQLEELKKAYNNETAKHEATDTDNGQS